MSGRFSRDAAALTSWMDGAREALRGWSQLPFAANQEPDLTEDSRHYQQFLVSCQSLVWTVLALNEFNICYSRGSLLKSLPFVVLFQDFRRELEARSDVKGSVMTTGAQLEQLMEAERETESQTPAPEPSPIHNQLRQIELDWAVIVSDVPMVQHTLHQVCALSCSAK